jgi:hypothetical protein
LDVDIDLDDDTAEERMHANRTELQAACDMAGRRDAAPLVGGFDGNNGIVQLPAGTIYVLHPDDQPHHILELDERHAGITIRGAGREKTVLIDRSEAHDGLFIVAALSRRISGPAYDMDGFGSGSTSVTVGDPDLCSENELLYSWNQNSGTDRSARQRCSITSVSGSTAHFTPALSTNWNSFRHYQGYSVDGGIDVGATTSTLEDSALAANFNINDDIMISDGPAINEVFAEWLRVTGVDSDMGTISFTPPVRQSYAEGLTCLLPAPHMSDITFRDLSFAGPIGDSLRIVGYFKYGVRLQLENIDIVRDGTDIEGSLNVGLENCGQGLINHFRTPGTLEFGNCSDFLVNDVAAKFLSSEEYCFDFQFTNLLLDGRGIHFNGSHDASPCRRMHVDHALFLNYGYGSGDASNSGFDVVEGSRISNVTMLFPQNDDAIFLNDDDISVSNFSTQSSIRVRGQNVRLSNISAPGLVFENVSGYGPSSGSLLTPLYPDSVQVNDTTSHGAWLRPLFVQNDGAIDMPLWSTASGATPPGLTIPSTDAGKVTMSVVGAEDQTDDLTQWLDHSSELLFAIRSDCNLKTANAVTVTLGSLVKALPIYDGADELIGYIPIYAGTE